MFLVSCSDDKESQLKEQNKVINDFCSCFSKSKNDSIVDIKLIDEYYQKCFDSIVVKNKITLGTSYIAHFDTIKKVNEIRNEVNETIVENVNTILKSHSFETEKDIFKGEGWLYQFDGKMVTITQYELWELMAWVEKDEFTGTYNIEISKDGLIHIKMKYDSKEQIFSFRKGSEKEFQRFVKEGLVEKGNKAVYFIKGDKELYSH